jgi:hypothetical protein
MTHGNALATAEYLISIKQNDDAKIVLDVMRKYCTTVEQLDYLGKLYSEIREHRDALDIALRLHSMIQDPTASYNLRSNIIRAYLNLNEPHKALNYIDINIRYTPDDHPLLMDKAMALFLLNRKPEAEAILRKILAEPHTKDIDDRIRFNLGAYDLANGDFKEGIRGVLSEGRKLNIWETYDLPVSKKWDGTPQPGKTVLMCSEGGIGDDIISIRFQRHIRAMGMRPVWYNNRWDLNRIFQRNGFEVTASLQSFQPDWLWCYGMLTPVLLGVDQDELWDGPYLKALSDSPWLEGDLKIGLKTMGNPKYDQDLHRTIPAKETIDCLPKDAKIYSFHIDEDLDDDRVISLRDRIKSWDDTLDYIEQMDIIISSCTSLAHAASAMGKRTIVLVPVLNYYTWGLPGRHSPWYSTNTVILRQQEYDNWRAPLAELKDIMRGVPPWI